MSTARTNTERGALYGRLWRGVPRELGFLLPTLPIVIIGLTAAWALISVGIGTLAIVVGFFVLVGVMYLARGFASFELLRLRGAGYPAIRAPRWDRAVQGGPIRRVFGVFTDGYYWLALLHTVLVNPIVGTISWSVSFTWAVTGLGGVTYWIYSRWIPAGDRGWDFLDVVVGFFAPGAELALEQRVADNVFFVVTGVLLLATLPFVTRAMSGMHYAIAQGMLGAFRSEGLERQVAGLTASRTAAVAAEGTALRRLERDIHDGPQQRLVRLQMDLAAAERQLDADPDRARTLLAEAMQQSKDALEELRALSRGFAPPILLDRGLVAALESLAVRSTVPVRLSNELDPALELPEEIERNAYFVASECLTNVAKHAGASVAELHLGVRRVPDGDDTWLELSVSDDGRGGAAPSEGHGLAGLDERLRGLGGVLRVESPEGGPTMVTAQLPLTTTLHSRLD